MIDDDCADDLAKQDEEDRIAHTETWADKCD